MRSTACFRRALCLSLTALTIGLGYSAAPAADDFNPPWWVDSDNNGLRDNRDEHMLKPGEQLVFGTNVDWVAPDWSTSYHWHWFPTQNYTSAPDTYFEEYDSFDSGRWYLPDHQENLWNQLGGNGWQQAKPTPMPRNWGDFDVAPLLINPRWGISGILEAGIPEGAPRGMISNAEHGGITWNRADTTQPYGGVFEVPLFSNITDQSLRETLVRLQYGGGFPDDTYWATDLVGFESDGTPIAATRTFRSQEEGTIYFEDWQFDGTPDWMRLTIDFTGTSMVDQVLIDTIAIPEPATLGILTIGTVWLVRRQRK